MFSLEKNFIGGNLITCNSVINIECKTYTLQCRLVNILVTSIKFGDSKNVHKIYVEVE